MKNAESLKGLSNRQKQGRTRIKTEDTLILDNPEWTIVIPHTHRAAIHWSKDALWDTAMKNDDTWFNLFNGKGNLYIIWNKSKNEGYQLHIETKSFFDDMNIPVKPLEFFTENQDVFNAIYIHLNSHDKQKQFINVLA